jgi:CRISPR-associated protein Csy2
MTAAAKALLVLPHLCVQNANAISSPLTHGFPSITALTGLMWALQRQLAVAGIPLKLQQVGGICHHHEEQVTDGYVKTFRLTRNPVDKDGVTAAIVEEGRIHLDLTVVFQVAQPLGEGACSALTLGNEAGLAEWAARVGEIVGRMRIAGGTLLPVRPIPGRRTRPWMAVLSEDHEEQARAFARWRRQWLPGYALVGRDDLLADRHRILRDERPDATLLDAWLHAARFNYQPVTEGTSDGDAQPASSEKQRWADPARRKGAGWTVPIPVGYAALTKPLPARAVANARDPSTSCVFVESVYSFGQWISPHRLNHVNELLWRPETDAATGLYRCRSGYVHDNSAAAWADDDMPDFD